jgi:hypothetical protein
VSFVVDFSTLFSSAYRTGSAGYAKDWGSLGAGAAGIAGSLSVTAVKNTEYYKAALKKAQDAAKDGEEVGSPTVIIDSTILILTLTDFLNGFGAPNNGLPAVSIAADKLDLFVKDLELCMPTPENWTGTAASAYIGQNAMLMGYATQMKALDARLQEQLAGHALKITHAHWNISIQVAALTVAKAVALALWAIPIEGPGISMLMQITLAIACATATVTMEALTLADSSSVSGHLATLEKDYATLGSDVQTTLAGSFGQLEFEGAPKTSSEVFNLNAISEGLTNFSPMPSISNLADAAGDSDSLDDKSSPGPSSPGLSSPGPNADGLLDDKSSPGPNADALTFTPPTLKQMSQTSAQISQMSQPISNVSQQASQVSQQINQAVQQGQQLAQSEKGQGDPAVDAADDTKDAEAGAAPGSGGTERAPIDAAESGTEPAGAGRERAL